MRRTLWRPSFSKGTTGLIDQCEIRYKSGGTSIVKFMTYDMQDQAWESDTVHLIWYDEEPEESKWDAGAGRIVTTQGLRILTTTPIFGMSTVIRGFYPTPDAPHKGFTLAGIEDALHIPAAKREDVIARFKPWERRCRVEGIPVLGSGMVYDVPEEVIKIKPFAIPSYWPRLLGMDLGGGSAPTCFVELNWDRDHDVIYLSHSYKHVDPRISTHAQAMRLRGLWIPVAWPHDGRTKDRAGDGISWADTYRQHGLRMLPTFAQFQDGGYAVEPGITRIGDRLATQRLRVFEHLTDWFDEYRFYHREEGLIVKEHDHLMDATRTGVMMISWGAVPPKQSHEVQTVSGMDYDPIRGY